MIGGTAEAGAPVVALSQETSEERRDQPDQRTDDLGEGEVVVGVRTEVIEEETVEEERVEENENSVEREVDDERCNLMHFEEKIDVDHETMWCK